MRKIIIITAFFFIVSCIKKDENIKQLDFYNKTIEVASFLIKDKEGINKPCKRNLTLKDKENNTIMSYRLCSYSYNERGNFEKLNSSFEEECDVLESEVLDLTWIDKKVLKSKKYYKYTFTSKHDSKYYHVTYLAYEKYYLTINIKSSEIGRLNELIETISLIEENESLSNININNKECLNCKFPTFW